MLPVAGPQLDFGQANPTLYVQNLNEKVPLKYLVPELKKTFSEHGEVVQVTAKKRLALRGQAFIIFQDTESARRALEALQGVRLYGKSMNIKFAKYKSDSVSKADGTYEIERRRREQDKSTKPLWWDLLKFVVEKSRQPRITRRQLLSQAMTNPTMQSMMMGPNVPMGAMAPGPHTAPQMFAPQMIGSELQIPHNVLYVQNLPQEPVDKELNEAFRRFAGFNEIRRVPTMPTVAFVEYETETQAAAARAALDNYEIIPGAKMRVSFSRRQ